MYDAVLILDRQ